jgi:hypothetical protein
VPFGEIGFPIAVDIGLFVAVLTVVFIPVSVAAAVGCDEYPVGPVIRGLT